MGKRLAVKSKQWLAFLQIRSAFATVALTAGAANTFHPFLFKLRPLTIAARSCDFGPFYLAL